MLLPQSTFIAACTGAAASHIGGTTLHVCVCACACVCGGRGGGGRGTATRRLLGASLTLQMLL